MLLPVPADVPPHEPVNHCATAPVPALPPESVSVVLPPLQIVVVPVIPVGATERVFTVNEALPDVFDANPVALTTQSYPVAVVEASPAATHVIVNVVVVVPPYVDPFPVAPSAMFTPFFRH